MLTRSQLAETAQKEGVPLQTVERDYIQHLFLRQTRATLLFKGGTCIRIAYGSPRYSEDLDFNGYESVSEVEDVLEGCAARLAAYGVRAEVRTGRSARTGYQGKLRYAGPLFDGRPVTMGSVRLEVSLRGEEVGTEERFVPKTPYADVPQLTLRVLSPAHLFAEKCRALMIRKEPRDLFDVQFLLAREITCSRELLDRKMSIYRRKFEPPELNEAIGLARKDWEQELSPLLGRVPPYDAVAASVHSLLPRDLRAER